MPHVRVKMFTYTCSIAVAVATAAIAVFIAAVAQSHCSVIDQIELAGMVQLVLHGRT